MFFNYSYSDFDITNKLLVSLHSANAGVKTSQQGLLPWNCFQIIMMTNILGV